MKKYTPAQFAQALQKMSAEIRAEALPKAVMNGARVVEAYAKTNAEKKFSDWTGNLSGSIQSVLESATGDRAEASVGPTAVYGRIQELGGTIKARGKFLAIPVNAKKGSRPREYSNLRFIRSKSGKGGVMMDAKGKVMFALKPYVILPARPYLRPAVDEHEDEIINAMGAVIESYVENAL